MDGTISVTYQILCENDFTHELTLETLLSNEAKLRINSIKKLYTFEVNKNDFADILVLAEEDAASKKLLKKECDRVELVDITTS